jgi:moderate conductance mechanosensitive channel
MPTPPVALVLAQAATPSGEEGACGAVEEASKLCVAVYRATGSDTVAALADTLVLKPAKVLLIVVLAFVVNRLIGRAIKRFVRTLRGERVQKRLGSIRDHTPAALLDTGQVPTLRSVQRAETIGALLRSIASFSVWVIAGIMILSELGLAIGPIVAGAGIAGIALGFGAQNLVRDFLSGIFMLVEDQYGVGDVIDAGPASGIVEAVTLRTTRLRDVNGVVWHIPNGTIVRVGNKSQQWSRALLDFDVAYATDVDQAGKLIEETIIDAWKSDKWRDVILEEPQVWGVENLGPDGVTIRVAVKTLPGEQFAVARHLRARVKETFQEAGIEIPFPQRTIWHRTGGGPLAQQDVKAPEEDEAPQAAPSAGGGPP